MARQEDPHYLGIVLGHPGQQVGAGHPGHFLVGYDDVDVSGLECVYCLVGRSGGVELVRLPPQGTGSRSPGSRVMP